ncbi:hypothetical protein NEPAR06_1826 [Nematocida parisii]|uniref:Uncharacterized protein n=1 Tax=Nematocida parisii (strain ERTm3) TaxID=935791 RepID=I3EJV2_NEMP3|nr:uncharacterized protein NEPG_00973 [Nematocida parisii ERTm1]EIJ89499.1 hypothetical protein NEQG_00269 [Nematocida parisii ERTm3]KAI5127476.1 hypothetical protein NEPAR03_0922 [Nematocida parisii]EIJ94306.1 hypothetical protein NEPG_00973 [Nematocida parisii ERTm1]KAI5130593.1 hypothetical protein NEPAR08_2102 [Nematocida parisii]KAI5144078.1 hypothetical protein NEPAR04_2055 [Nematocida parisii]|eukprot:XP_013058802.1 hypothetical protein NEPG_00973 [Nematocida parisii ERTm1]
MEQLKEILKNKKNPLKRAESLNIILESEECEGISLVPSTANFQIPEVFLSTKILPECETYFIQERSRISPVQVEEWNNRVDSVIDELSVEFTISNPVHTKHIPSDHEVIEAVKEVLGYTE